MKNSIEYLNAEVNVTVDRHYGSRHPSFGYIYPVNYGYLPHTLSSDGEELDAYILGVEGPVDEYEGVCIAIIHREDDDDDKLVIVPTGICYSDEEIRSLTKFQEQYFNSIIIRKVSSG